MIFEKLAQLLLQSQQRLLILARRLWSLIIKRNHANQRRGGFSPPCWRGANLGGENPPLHPYPWLYLIFKHHKRVVRICKPFPVAAATVESSAARFNCPIQPSLPRLDDKPRGPRALKPCHYPNFFICERSLRSRSDLMTLAARFNARSGYANHFQSRQRRLNHRRRTI